MLKVNYQMSNLFSYKKYNFSNLNAASYAYPLVYGIRSAILGQATQIQGTNYAESIFNKIKNAIIYVQHPENYNITGQRLRRASNASYKKNYNNAIQVSGLTCEECKSNLKINYTPTKNEFYVKCSNKDCSLEKKKIKVDINDTNLPKIVNMEVIKGMSTMGYREFIDLFDDGITFYIDKSIPDIELYLKNIDCFGTTESMVYLNTIEETDKLENVLVEWDEDDVNNDCYTYEQRDWDSKIKFENAYLYSKKYKNINKRIVCCVKDLILPS